MCEWCTEGEEEKGAGGESKRKEMGKREEASSKERSLAKLHCKSVDELGCLIAMGPSTLQHEERNKRLC